MILDRIKGPEDVRRLTYKQTEILAEEIRRFLIETTSRTGGHLASNLGVVELTIAMYRVFKSDTSPIPTSCSAAARAVLMSCVSTAA